MAASILKENVYGSGSVSSGRVITTIGGSCVP